MGRTRPGCGTASTRSRSISNPGPGRVPLAPEFSRPPRSWSASDDEARGRDYDCRLAALAATGVDMHGEATFVETLGARSVLDAGCGTGRVAIELARRGFEAVGVDADAGMLAAARAKAPDLEWVTADLSKLDLAGRRFDVALMAGNVMIFVQPGTEDAVLKRLAAHLRSGGAVVAGFQLVPGGLTLERYDELASAAGLTLTQRYATWDRDAWQAGGAYAVSVHRRNG